MVGTDDDLAPVRVDLDPRGVERDAFLDDRTSDAPCAALAARVFLIDAYEILTACDFLRRDPSEVTCENESVWCNAPVEHDTTVDPTGWQRRQIGEPHGSITIERLILGLIAGRQRTIGWVAALSAFGDRNVLRRARDDLVRVNLASIFRPIDFNVSYVSFFHHQAPFFDAIHAAHSLLTNAKVHDPIMACKASGSDLR